MPDLRHLAVASARSPRFRAVIAEAWRLARLMGSERFSIIHVGERTTEAAADFAEACAGLGLDAGAVVHWLSGEPADAIVQFAAEQQVGLIVAGALERDTGPHFLSGVARALLRQCPCSLLLVTEPAPEPRPFRRLVMVTDFSESSRRAFRAALALAEKDEAESLHVLSVYTPFSAARADLGTAQGPVRGEEDEETRLEQFVEAGADSPVEIDVRVIHSTTGLGASDFSKTIEADLLVVPAAADAQGGTLLPAYMDWVIQVIPCSLWVVKAVGPDPSFTAELGASSV